MSLSGTRGLIRISKNNTCERQAAMVADAARLRRELTSERELYRRVTGQEYPREFGERLAARRRGAKFEANLGQNNAALLREAIAPRLRLDPATMVVRDFAAEWPGAGPHLNAVRLSRMRRLLADLAAGRPVPHLLIQPQLCLPIGPGSQDIEYVTPDILVFDPSTEMYRPGELKSFIVRGGVADKADLDGTRRQAAAQILALKAEARRVGLEGRVDDRALFIFATPYGLKPAPPFEESLSGEIREMRRAARVLLEARKRLAEMRRIKDDPLHLLVDDLGTHFQNSCIGSCVLADHCSKQCVDQVQSMGDEVAEIFGFDIDVDRLVALASGAQPTNDREAEAARLLTDAMDVLPHLRQAFGKAA
jgi:hypothetical protein